MNKTEVAILARCAETASGGTDYAGLREARAARNLESKGLGRIVRHSIVVEWKQNNRRDVFPIGRFVWYGYEIRRYDDPSGLAHVRTNPHWQLWRGGECIFTAPTTREIIRFLTERQIEE